jgi:hypothetical protein
MPEFNSLFLFLLDINFPDNGSIAATIDYALAASQSKVIVTCCRYEWSRLLNPIEMNFQKLPKKRIVIFLRPKLE